MEAGEFIPLARAAALAHERLLPGQAKDTKTLDLLALALSAHIPLYQQENEKLPARELGSKIVSAGRFTRGATRLELGDRAPLRVLVVARAERARGLQAGAEDQLLAATLSRPRPPARSSATGA